MNRSKRKRVQSSPPCVPIGSNGKESWVVDLSRVLSAKDYSSRNSTATANTSTRGGTTIIVIMEARGATDGSVGLAIHDVRYPEIEVCEFVESREYSRIKTMIHVADADEIIIPHTADEKGTTKLLAKALSTAFPGVQINSVHMRHFNAQRGKLLAQSLANKEVSKYDDELYTKTLAMSSLATLIKYIQQTRVMHFRDGSMRIKEVQIENTCMIDFASWDSLELIDASKNVRPNRAGSRERRSLLSVVDNTITLNGKRHLRSNLLQPSADKKLIEARLDVVDELCELPQLAHRLRGLLSRAHELDTIMAMCVQSSNVWNVRNAEWNVTQMVKLCQTLQVIESMRDLMVSANVKSSILSAKVEYLTDVRFSEMINILSSCFTPIDPSNRKTSLALRNLKCFAIKEGISSNLDVAREAYRQLLDKVDEISGELAIQLPHKEAKLSYSNARGFHYSIVCENASSFPLPHVFIQAVRNKSSLTFTSRSMMAMNDRIEQTVNEVMLASDVVVFDLIEKIRPLLPVLYYAMDALSTIDFLCSLSVYATSRSTVRPQWADSMTISGGRHPILDWADPDNVVTNDTCLRINRQFGIITGPNMAGKSTYLKQVAQLCILAQTGCPIPASFAMLPVFTRIFSRMGHNDSLMRGKSAFAAEMSDASVILRHADSRSLVVIDELARSTSTEEGIAITYAICERIISLKCFTLLATHYLDIAVLDQHSMNVENFYFRALHSLEADEQLKEYRHKLLKGPYRGPLYGLELVELSIFPDSVVSQATILANQLRNESGSRHRDYEFARKRLLVDVYYRFRDAAKQIGDAPPTEETKRLFCNLRTYMMKELRTLREEQEYAHH